MNPFEVTKPTLTHSETPKALLAEDDSLLRELVSLYLKKLGYEVREAANGAIALDILKDETAPVFDLIVTDLLMPKAGGEKVIKQAKDQGACDRFLIMSGNPLSQEEENAPLAANSRYIEKPFSFGDFKAKLHSLSELQVAQGA